MPSRKRKEPETDWRALCAQPDEDDGVDPRDDRRQAARFDHKPDRKLFQLCKQVGQSVQLALGELPRADALVGVNVQSVLPAPHAGRLCVTLTVPHAEMRGVAGQVVARHAGRLRAAVAAAITRRRAPVLTFEVLVEELPHE